MKKLSISFIWHLSPIGRGDRLKIYIVWVRIPEMLLKQYIMSKLLSRYYALAAMMGALTGDYSQTIFEEDNHYTSNEPTKPTKTRKEQLENKGLQEFEINGVKIIAHNEKEAMKRYKHRSK